MELFLQDILARLDHLPALLVNLFFFLSAVLQITFPPYPGDTVFIFGGSLATARGFGAVTGIFLSYFTGTVISSLVLYELGVWKGDLILKFRMIARYFPEDKQASARKWVLKYGPAVLLLCKYIPGLNSIIIIFCGIFRYKRLLAYVAITVAALTHNAAFFTAGRLLGSNWNRIGRFLSLYNRVAIGAAAALGLLCLLFYLFARARKKKMQSPD